MKIEKHSIKKMVGLLNNTDADGGIWLPNIQRPFVWSETQICKLFDSILREYPISTLLIWKTNSTMTHRSFCEKWKDSLKISDLIRVENGLRKSLVLDGQQRLQALLIGLRGSFNGRELFFDILSGEVAAPDDIKFYFGFMLPNQGKFPWIKFKTVVYPKGTKRELVKSIIASSDVPLTDSEKGKVEDHVDLVSRTFLIEDTITFQELDSVDNPTLYTEDDVVEVFIRANSGGTKLGKSDLLFSLLNASWDDANERMEVLLDKLNRYGYEFDRDFVLKTCLVLLGHGAKYEIVKFRKVGVREAIEHRWGDIETAISDVLDFVRSKTYLQCDKALPTYLVLIPLVYLRFHYSEAFTEGQEIDTYLLRASLAGAFSGVPDNLIDGLVRKFDLAKRFRLDDAFEVIRGQQRSLELTEERFWSMGYGSKNVHLLFNLWYQNFSYIPAYENNLPQVDHVFPQSKLREVQVESPATGRQVMKYRGADRDQLANCMLLTRKENGAGGKGSILPSVWFAGKPAEYLNLHAIPHDPALWELGRFDDFIAARKQLILEKFRYLLVRNLVATDAMAKV